MWLNIRLLWIGSNRELEFTIGIQEILLRIYHTDFHTVKFEIKSQIIKISTVIIFRNKNLASNGGR